MNKNGINPIIPRARRNACTTEQHAHQANESGLHCMSETPEERNTEHKG